MTRTSAVLGLIVVSVAINYLDRGALSVSAPVLSRELNLSPAQMGLLFSAFFWSYASFQLVAGWLVDRFSVKWVYAAGFLVWSLATAAVGLISTLPVLIVARLLLGAGESVAYPATSKILARDFPEDRRGFANALVDAGSKIGPGLSTLLGGLLVTQFGWRALFLGVGIGSLLWLLPWMLWVDNDSAHSGPRSATGVGWRAILRRREAWGTSLGMFCLGYVWYFLLSWLPSYLVKERGFSMNEMAVLGSLPFWGMAGSSLVFGWTSDRWIRSGGNPTRVRKSFVVGGLLSCGAVMLPSALVSHAGASVVLITVACLCLGMFTSNVWAITQTLAGPEAAGKWTGIQNAIGNLGGVLSPLITGWVVSATGSFTLAFAVATAVLVAGAAAYLTMVREVRPLQWSAPTTERVVGA